MVWLIPAFIVPVNWSLRVNWSHSHISSDFHTNRLNTVKDVIFFQIIRSRSRDIPKLFSHNLTRSWLFKWAKNDIYYQRSIISNISLLSLQYYFSISKMVHVTAMLDFVVKSNSTILYVAILTFLLCDEKSAQRFNIWVLFRNSGLWPLPSWISFHATYNKWYPYREIFLNVKFDWGRSCEQKLRNLFRIKNLAETYHHLGCVGVVFRGYAIPCWSEIGQSYEKAIHAFWAINSRTRFWCSCCWRWQEYKGKERERYLKTHKGHKFLTQEAKSHMQLLRSSLNWHNCQIHLRNDLCKLWLLSVEWWCLFLFPVTSKVSLTIGNIATDVVR